MSMHSFFKLHLPPTNTITQGEFAQPSYLHYLRAGDAKAETIVLLHSLPQTVHAWRYLMPVLAEKYQVIAIDLYGLGDSSHQRMAQCTTTMIEALFQLLNHLHVEQPVLVGQGLGGVLCYFYAQQYPDKTRGLVLLESLIPRIKWQDNPELIKEVMHVLGFFAQAEIPELLLTGKETDFLTWLFRHYSHNIGVFNLEEIAFYASYYKHPLVLQAALSYCREFVYQAFTTTALQENPMIMPILALGGESGLGMRVIEGMEGLAEHVQGGTITNCGHWMAEEQPQAVAEAILSFVNLVFASR